MSLFLAVFFLLTYCWDLCKVVSASFLHSLLLYLTAVTGSPIILLLHVPLLDRAYFFFVISKYDKLIYH